jgi:hypothetical protein
MTCDAYLHRDYVALAIPLPGAAVLAFSTPCAEGDRFPR